MHATPRDDWPQIRSAGMLQLLFLVALAFGFTMFLPERLRAQSQAIDGTIEGTVQTESRQPLPGATVQAVNIRTGYEREGLADAKGRYAVPLLPPGDYVLIASASGHATVSRANLILRAGEVLTVHFEMPAVTFAETVEVTAALPAVEVGRTVISNTTDERTVRAMPTLGRSIQDFFIIQPGVHGPPAQTTGSATGTLQTTYGGLGLRQMNVDGVSNNLQGGARNLVISQESIQEFQTVTNFSAEFGRVAGGLQNAITRSGSNSLRGSAYLFSRQQFLSARPSLARPGTQKPDFWRYNFGGTLSGPLVRNRAFYFLNYERWMQDESTVSTFQSEAASRLGIPADQIGTFNVPFRAHTLTAKADVQVSKNNRISTRYFFYYDREAPNTFGGPATKDVAARFDEAPQSITTQFVSVLGRNVLNELRFLFATRGVSNGVGANPDAPNIVISGVGNFNGNANGHRRTSERGFHIVNNLSISRGPHLLKIGLDVVPVSFQERTTNINGTFVFGGLLAVPGVRGVVSPVDQFLLAEAATIDPATGRPYSYSRFTQSVGREFVEALTVNQGYFLQDDIRLTSHLKLSVGLRYERFTRPEANPNPALPATGVFPADTNNWAPRAAVAWDLAGDGRTVVRGGFGVFYNMVTPQTYNTFQRSNGVDLVDLNVSPTTPGAPLFNRSPVEPARDVGGIVSDVRVFDPDFEDITVGSWFVTAEREIFPHYSLGVTYQGNRATNLPVSLNVNLAPAGTLPDGRRRWSTTNRPNPQFGNIFVASSIGDQDYHGLIVTLTKRFSRGFSFQASHHWSRTEGAAFPNDFSGFGIFTTPSDPLDLEVDRGTGDFDMPHRFTLTGVFEPLVEQLSGGLNQLLNHWQFGMRLVATQGYAFDARTGRDDNGDTVFNDRPSGIPRNAFRVPGYFNLDIRASRLFKFGGRNTLEFMIEGFNLANQVIPSQFRNVNNTWGVGTTPNPAFGTVTNAEAPRQFQLGARFTF